MGEGYTETDAASFAAHRLEEYAITDTDEMDSEQWVEAMANWEAPVVTSYRIRGTHPEAEALTGTVTETPEGVWVALDTPHVGEFDFRTGSMADWLNHFGRLGWVWVRLDGKPL